MISRLKIREFLLGFTILLLLSACGGGGGGSSSDSSSPTLNILSGVFIDAKVKGLHYKTATQNGYTNSEGKFKYVEGETIEFYLGDLLLGSAKAKKLMTPYTLSGDTNIQNPSFQTLNIAMLLQNFDANRSNSTLLDISRLKEYKFTNIDLTLNNSAMESSINTLLSTASFWRFIDSNNTLIQTQGSQTHLIKNVEKVVCSIVKITDDRGFTDNYPTDIAWSGSSTTVADIARVFNYARARDTTITQKLVMPSQSVWDSMSIQERGLYILNNERYYRGIKPYEGVSSRVSAVSLSYANVLYTKGTFRHDADGSPIDRLNRDSLINNNHDYFSYAENLYAHGSSSDYVKNPIARAMYGFIYDDNVATGGSYGHRKFCFAVGLNDDSGKSGSEGLVGFGIKKGTSYGLYPNYFSTIVVMNAFDPSSSWNHNSTLYVPFCNVALPVVSSNARFDIDDIAGVVEDKTTHLVWQNMSIGHSKRPDAINRCTNLTHGGFSDWRLPSMAESKIFHKEMNSSGLVPNQLFEHCTAEVVNNGYIRTQKGAQKYGGTAGDSINFSGGANVRCVRN